MAEPVRRMAETRAVFTRRLLAAKGGAGHPDATPIFVLGMPRAGTTLVETRYHPATV